MTELSFALGRVEALLGAGATAELWCGCAESEMRGHLERQVGGVRPGSLEEMRGYYRLGRFGPIKAFRPQDWNRCPKKAYVDGPGLSPRTSLTKRMQETKEGTSKGDGERMFEKAGGDPKECGVLEA